MTSPLQPTAVFADPECLRHEPGLGHHESPARLLALVRLLQGQRLRHLPLQLQSGRLATPEEILRVHTEAYLQRLRVTRGLNVRLDPDTHTSPESYDVALHAAGSTLAAVEAVYRGQVRRAMVLVRPPGHHAEPDRAMGFCLLNNVAIAAQHARKVLGAQRVAIVDFDAHHGNGTQAAFWTDPSVLYISTHQAPLYPGTGAATELGDGAGRGRTINIPLGAEHGDAEFDAIYGGLIARLLEQFRPEIILVSCGYDIAATDPLAGMSVTYEGFLRIVGHLCNTADLICRGRLVGVLEGGYSIAGLEDGVAATLEAMCGAVMVEDPKGPLVRLPLGDAARHLYLYRDYFDI